MESMQSFHSNHFCDNSQLIFSNGIFKKYYITDEAAKVLNNKVCPLAVCPSQSHNLKVCPELYKTQLYNNFQKSYVNDFERRLRPYPVFDHHTGSFEDMMNARLKKQRSEKKPVPEEKKDALYYEKRKRNNKAAKKSRDARKLREDQIAFKASILENENALLRTQVIALREEAAFLRHLLMKDKNN